MKFSKCCSYSWVWKFLCKILIWYHLFPATFPCWGVPCIVVIVFSFVSILRFFCFTPSYSKEGRYERKHLPIDLHFQFLHVVFDANTFRIWFVCLWKVNAKRALVAPTHIVVEYVPTLHLRAHVAIYIHWHSIYLAGETRNVEIGIQLWKKVRSADKKRISIILIAN